MDYLIHILVLIVIYTMLAQGLNLSFGAGRLFNLAHIAIYSLGAYTTAILTTKLNVGFIECLATASLISALASLIIGGISIKLSDDYFAIGTISFAYIISAVEINWKSLTNGSLGIAGIPRPVINGIDYYNNTHFLILTLGFSAFTQFIIYLLLYNNFGRNLKIQAESPLIAETLGSNIKVIKILSFVVASITAGIAGSFYASYISYIDPFSFSLSEMIFVLTIVVLGKPASFWGTILSTIFLIALPEILRFIYLPPSILGHTRQIIYALVLLSAIYIKKDTLFPIKRQV